MMDRNRIFLTRQQSRMIDQLAMAGGIDGITLMENAGRGCFLELMKRGVQSAVIMAGVGNNGGDGFVIARYLAESGVAVKIVLAGSAGRLSPDSLVNYRRAVDAKLEIVEIVPDWSESRIAGELSEVNGQPSEWIVDALLGTGATGNPRNPVDRLIRMANRLSAKKMAIDVPSGLDCDTGRAGEPTFRADVSCTMATSKIGFKLASAADWLGEVTVIPIGIADSIVEQVIAANTIQ